MCRCPGAGTVRGAGEEGLCGAWRGLAWFSGGDLATWEGFAQRRSVICPSPQPQRSAVDMGLSGWKDGLSSRWEGQGQLPRSGSSAPSQGPPGASLVSL